MKKTAIAIIFLFVNIFNFYSQELIWQKSFGGSNNDGFTRILKTNDGGYIVGGYSESNDYDTNTNHGNSDIWLVKLDQDFNIQWQKSFGGSNDEFLRELYIDNQGNYILIARTESNDGDVAGYHPGGPLPFDIWVVKVNQQGNIIWQKCLGGNDMDTYVTSYLNEDGSLMIFSNSYSNISNNHGMDDICVFKISTDGNFIWQKSYGGSSSDGMHNAIKSSDGNFVLVGQSTSNDGDLTSNNGSSDLWILKINANNGNIIWQKSFGGSSSDGAYSIIEVSSGGFLVGGWASSNDGDISDNYGGADIWFLRISDTGNLIWEKNFGGSNSEYSYDMNIFEIDGNGYVFSALTNSNDHDISDFHGGIYDVWIVKISSVGNIVWSKTFGGSRYDIFRRMYKINNNYMIVGETRSNDGDISGFHQGGTYPGSNYYYPDAWVFKIRGDNGNLIWQKAVGSYGYDSAYKLLDDISNGYILIGQNGENSGDVSGNHGNKDAFIFKLKLDFPIFKSLDFYTQTTPNPNNPNNYLNQGLPIRFKVKVKNELAQNLSALSGTITCSTPGVTISDNTVNFSTILSGNETWSTDEFEITVDPSVANGTNLEFELSCNDPLVSGGPWISYFSFPIAPLQTGTIVLVDNNGDNDGVPEPGESNIILQPKIDNVSNYALASVRGILSSDDSFLNITQNDNMYNVSNNVPESINQGDTDITPGLPYYFDYPSTSPLQELNFNLELQANLNDNNGTLLKWQDSFSFNDGIEPPPSIVSTIPQDDAVDVAIDTDLNITFDKNITAVSGKNIYLYKSGSLQFTIPVTGSNVSINNDTVTIDLSSDLDGGSNYFVIIDQGAFIDSSSQEFAGISSQSEWNFTTVQSDPPVAPVISATAISDTEIELNWNTVADADSYSVFSCNETITYVQNINTTTYTVTGLTEQTAYDFIVKAENQAGLSPASNCESATTLCSLPWGSPVIYTNFTRAFCEVTIDGQPAEQGDKVAAFIGTELRGIGDVFVSNGTAYAVVNIQGEVVETAGFKVWDSSECVVLDVNYTTSTSPAGTIGASPNYLPIDASSSSSVLNNNVNDNIIIYPNPVNNILFIKTIGQIKINKIEIYDVMGKLIKTYKKEVKTIDIQKFSKGVYLIKLLTKDGVYSKQIIKN